MAIIRRHFGDLPDGGRVDSFTFSSASGVKVVVSNYGCAIMSILAPDRDGEPGEVCMGFDNLEAYLGRNYIGAVIGRVANRIRGGEFSLDGVDYKLWTDAGGIHLHGGDQGFNAKLWEADVDGDRLRLQYVSPNGEENYPGDLTVNVWYSLMGTDLVIEYEAVTDEPTLVNLTNHAYFNLNGCKRDIMDHVARISADFYNPVDASLLPTGETAPVKGTPFDFNAAKPIGRDFAKVPGGYDHNFVLSRAKPEADEWLAEVHDPDSGRTLAMATTEPCVQFYTGNFLDGSQTGHGGVAYRRHYGFCLEAQKHPDAIHHPNFAPIVLRPGELYSQTTIYRFGREK